MDGIWILVIIIGIFLLFGGKKEQPSQKNVVSLKVTSPTLYSIIVSSLESIVIGTVYRCNCAVIVMIQVHKIDSTYSRIECSLKADTTFNDSFW